MIGAELALALVGASCVGLSLGLLGSGGSILTVPLLVYLVRHSEKAAIAESLAIVGVISLFGAVRRLGQGSLQWRAIVTFGPASMIGAWLGASLAQWIPGAIQLLALGVVMLVAAALMLRRSAVGRAAEPRPRRLTLAVAGLGVGVVTGTVGIGGGFLIVPALVVIGGLPARRAVETSLALISLNCVIGFGTYWLTLRGDASTAIDAPTVAIFSGLGILGASVGQWLGALLSQAAFRRVFAAFILVTGLSIVIREAAMLASVQ